MLGLISYLQARNQRRAINQGSYASNPLSLRMSDTKLRRLCPSLYCLSGPLGFLRCSLGDGWGRRFFIRDMLVHGDSRAAVVVSLSPFLVACYCDDLDGVCVLQFCGDLAAEHGLRRGDHLLTVLNSNSILRRRAQPNEIAPDLVQGIYANPYYVNFWPLIAEFLSDDMDVIAARKERISEEEYARCRSLGDEHIRRFQGAARDGRPDRSMWPVKNSQVPRSW